MACLSIMCLLGLTLENKQKCLYSGNWSSIFRKERFPTLMRGRFYEWVIISAMHRIVIFLNRFTFNPLKFGVKVKVTSFTVIAFYSFLW